MTVAAYIRVSSKGQDYETQRDAIERKGVKVERWYREKASAKTTQRPVLQEVLTDARAGVFSELWLFKLDRLTRSGVTDTYRVVGELRAAGVTLHLVADGVTIKPGEDIVSDVFVFALGMGAKIEHQARNERIAAARTRMAAAGEPWGRPPRMTGAERATAERMRGEGRTVREISAALGVPKSTVARLVAQG